MERFHAPARWFVNHVSKNGDAMKEKSRIRLNPDTKEIEIEGSEEFVKIYFNKLQNIILGSSLKTLEESKGARVRPTQKAALKGPKAVKRLAVKKVTQKAKSTAAKKVKIGKKATVGKKKTNIDRIVGLIQGSTGGIATAQLKEKTGLAENQIWNIVNRATKLGKIKKIKRGIYGAP
jgi:hypothetical protein